MREEQAAVAEFMRRNDFKVDTRLEELRADGASGLLDLVSSMLKPIVALLKNECKHRYQDDDRVARAFLMLEELDEALEAMVVLDEVALADALADTAYTVLGTAATFGIPLKEVFDEVHRSNMTKVRTIDGDRLLKAGKGALYSPPNIPDAIARGRSTVKETA